jgi:hypothetical protein
MEMFTVNYFGDTLQQDGEMSAATETMIDVCHALVMEMFTVMCEVLHDE